MAIVPFRVRAKEQQRTQVYQWGISPITSRRADLSRRQATVEESTSSIWVTACVIPSAMAMSNIASSGLRTTNLLTTGYPRARAVGVRT